MGLRWIFVGFTLLVFPLTHWYFHRALLLVLFLFHSIYYQGFARIHMLIIPKSQSLKQKFTPELQVHVQYLQTKHPHWMLLKPKTQGKYLTLSSLLLFTCISQIHAFVFITTALYFRAHSCYFLPASLKAFSYVDSLTLVLSQSMHSPHWSQRAFSKHISTYLDPLLSNHLVIPQRFQDESKLPGMTQQGPSWSVLHFHFHTWPLLSFHPEYAMLSSLSLPTLMVFPLSGMPFLLLSSRQGSFSSSITWSPSGKTPSFFLICSFFLSCAPLSEVLSLVYLPQETLSSFKVQ